MKICSLHSSAGMLLEKTQICSQYCRNVLEKSVVLQTVNLGAVSGLGWQVGGGGGVELQYMMPTGAPF